MRSNKDTFIHEALVLDNIPILITRKRIKNIYLRIHPPGGEVFISAPMNVATSGIREFALGRLKWIKQHIVKIRLQTLHNNASSDSKTTHMVWGAPYHLQIHLNQPKNHIYMDVQNSILQVEIGKPECPDFVLARLLEGWDKLRMRRAAEPLISKWRAKFGLPDVSLRIRNMKTRWGSCTPSLWKITLNSQLAAKDLKFLEYVIANELTHFFVPNHGNEFKHILDLHIPHWRSLRQELNNGMRALDNIEKPATGH